MLYILYIILYYIILYYYTIIYIYYKFKESTSPYIQDIMYERVKTEKNKRKRKKADLVSISSTFYVRIFRTNVVFLVTFWLCHKNSYEKFARLTLMKLTAGVNFINILHTVFSYESLFSTYVLAL
jgi:hypothetical protein